MLALPPDTESIFFFNSKACFSWSSLNPNPMGRESFWYAKIVKNNFHHLYGVVRVLGLSVDIFWFKFSSLSDKYCKLVFNTHKNFLHLNSFCDKKYVIWKFFHHSCKNIFSTYLINCHNVRPFWRILIFYMLYDFFDIVAIIFSWKILYISR